MLLYDYVARLFTPFARIETGANLVIPTLRKVRSSLRPHFGVAAF